MTGRINLKTLIFKQFILVFGGWLLVSDSRNTLYIRQIQYDMDK